MHSNTTSPKSTRTPDLEAAEAITGDQDTIVAIATPPGRGGVSIIRASGPEALSIAAEITSTPETSLSPGRVSLRDFLSTEGKVIDSGLVITFQAPASYTGENVMELHAHGSPVVSNMLLQRCIQAGARLARPGEFTERAFLNDRMDLTQAEAVADLIESSTAAAARSALNALKGGFSDRIHQLVSAVTELRIYVEAAIDFPEEEIDFLAGDEVKSKLQEIEQKFDSLQESMRQGQLLRDGLKVVMTGRPNAGKSSLLNALSQENRAIVSAIPGTTRDVLSQHIDIDGIPVELIDTAGIRESSDEIEAEGVRRAQAALNEADLVLLVVDDAHTNQQEIENMKAQYSDLPKVCLVRNKIDLSGRSVDHNDEPHTVSISATQGQGIDSILAYIKTQAGYRESDDSHILARQRHISTVSRARDFFDQGLAQMRQVQAGELLAEDLALCQRTLGEITGEVTSDDLLGLIFSSFCIGK